MTRRTGRPAFLMALAAMILVQVGSVSVAEQPKPGAKTAPPNDTPRGFWVTIVYDNNIAASRDGTLNIPIGNVFTPPWQTFDIVAISFKLAGCQTSPYIGARAFIQDIDPTAMTVMQLRTFSAAAGPGNNCNAGALYTGMFSPVMGHHGPFFGGILNDPVTACAGNTMVGGFCEGVALTAGLMDPGMGFHAVRVNGAMYTPITPPRNAIFRASFDNVPVELMTFGVE